MGHDYAGRFVARAHAPDALTADDHDAIADAMRRAMDRDRLGGLETVLSRAGVGILHRDLERHVLLANDAFCAIVGRSPAALDGLPVEEFTHPDDVGRALDTYRTHLATGTPFEIEQRYRRPDGSDIWCAVHVSFVPGPDGRPRSTITVASDITARHEAQARLRESEEHYRHSVELHPQIAWTADASGAILEVSPRWEEASGLPLSAALGREWLAAVHPDDMAEAAERWRASLATRTPLDIEYRLRARNGSYRWMRGRAAARLDDRGNAVRWYGTLEDIHERREAQEALRESEQRFRLAAQAAGLGIWDYDALRDRREWSDEFKAMLGLKPDAEPQVATALALVVPEDRHLLQALVDAAQAGDSSARFEVMLRIRRADTDAERWIRTDGWRIHAPSGRLERVLVTIRDVTDERTAEDRVRWTATHDALTAIPNRAFFADRLDAAIAEARATRGELALVLLDVDHLKEVNDTIGHDAGDALLRTFADRLRHSFGDATIIGRLGGDEFAVLLDGVDRTTASRRVAAALDLLRQPFIRDGHSCDTQATAGAAMFPHDGDTAEDLLKSADIALYAGKNGQRGELAMFRPAMRADIQRRTSMLTVARVALRDDLVVPYYQPKVSLVDRRITGFEALLRWRQPHFAIHGPETIASAFDDFGLAVALGDRMIDRIARDIRDWLDRGFDPGRVAINLSPAEFRHDRLTERVLDAFAAHGVPGERIELEITETVLLGRDTDRVAATLRRFHDAGLSIALDDFGTGYASLTHLKMFPVDVIKIDRSFVSNLRPGSDDAAIVDAVLDLAHRLKIHVVAEGIEREEQARYLRDRGCATGQGFLFGHAVPAEAARALLAGPATSAS